MSELREVRPDAGGTAVLLTLGDAASGAAPVRVGLRRLRGNADRDAGRLRVAGARVTGPARFEVEFSDGQRRLYGVSPAPVTGTVTATGTATVTGTGTATVTGTATGAAPPSDQSIVVRAMGPTTPGDLVVRNIGQLVTCAESFGALTAAAAGPDAVGAITNAVVVIRGGAIAWVGRARDLPAGVIPGGAAELDAGGGCVMPGLVDAHNHLVFAGDRASEYAARLAGASYADILKAGGGILHTVRATRHAPAEVLAELARERLDRLLSFGVTTSEAKSGYGLERAAEWKILEVARALGDTHAIELVPTFLGAHAVPAERRGSEAERAAYVDELCAEQIPAVAAADLARFCDVFVDDGAYTVAEGERILRAAAAAGLGLKIHAEEIAHTGAAAMAAALGATSADHLERLDEAGIDALAAAGTVAVLLPGTATVLGLPPPPVQALRAAGVPLALGTDLNPGTCNSENLGLMVGLACAHFRLSVEEAVLGVTRHAARALGVEARCGALTPGRRGDLVVLDAPDYRHLAYRLGISLARVVVKEGEVAWRAN